VKKPLFPIATIPEGMSEDEFCEKARINLAKQLDVDPSEFDPPKATGTLLKPGTIFNNSFPLFPSPPPGEDEDTFYEEFRDEWGFDPRDPSKPVTRATQGKKSGRPKRSCNGRSDVTIPWGGRKDRIELAQRRRVKAEMANAIAVRLSEYDEAGKLYEMISGHDHQRKLERIRKAYKNSPTLNYEIDVLFDALLEALELPKLKR
jgi:hypothetical protein